MTPQASLPRDWTEALELAQRQAQHVREGLTTTEFAALAGVHPNTVGKVARQGLKAFQERFGPGCFFEKVNCPNSSLMQWRLTFTGAILPGVNQPPVPGALRAWEFHERMQLKVTVFSLYGYRWRGHAWFRRRFPGWDFMEVPVPNSEQVICWYVPVAVIGEQADVLPEDNLTAVQFAQLKGIAAAGHLKKLCRTWGLGRFEATYPGWSFRQEGEAFIFFRTGPELPQFNVNQFARHMGVGSYCVSRALTHHYFEERFPGWRAQNFVPEGLASGSWRIYPISPQVKTIAGPEQEAVAPRDDGELPPWLGAMIQNHSELVQEIRGIDRVEFARLVGHSPNQVLRIIRRGKAAFKDSFGAGCTVEKVTSCQQPFRYQFSFLGRVYPAALRIPGLRLVAEKQFAMEQGQSLAAVRLARIQGNEMVQATFPGWYWVALADPFRPGQWVGLFVQTLVEGRWG